MGSERSAFPAERRDRKALRRTQVCKGEAKRSVSLVRNRERRAAGNAVVETARFLITQRLRHWRRDT